MSNNSDCNEQTKDKKFNLQTESDKNIKAIKKLLEIEDSSDEESSYKNDKEKGKNPIQNINDEHNNITKLELEDLKQNINVILGEDFPEENESDEEQNIKNNHSKNLGETIENKDLNPKLENQLLDEKKIGDDIIRENRIYKRSHDELPLIIRGKKNTSQTSPDKIIPEKYLIKSEEFTIENNPKKIYYRKLEFSGKKFYLSTKKEELEKNRDMYYYCVNHGTTKTSEKIDNKGNKKRINICDSRIHYNKNRDVYLFLQDHSKECDNLVKEIPTNFLEINKEISNYQEFRKNLKEYLGKNPNTNFNDFKKEADKLYAKNNFQFSIGEHFYSNIYYNWRKLSNAFNKYSIFENQKTLDDKQLLRDFSQTILYNKNNNSTFQHEHIIFISDYFIKKLNKAEHFYIDGTFIYPQDFKQLIVILYLEENINKRMPRFICFN